MKAIVINEFGGPDVMQVEEIEKPVPAADEVLVKVSAAGINYADIAVRKDAYLSRTKLPYVLGIEAAGVVEAIGSDVKGFKIGQRVLAFMTGGGGYAEYAAANAGQVFPIPDGIDFGEATALLVQGMTALGLLKDAKAGQSILVHAAAGGVGTLLVQLAKQRGLTVIGTASSTEKLEKVLSIGADHAVNYSEDDWTQQVLDATGGKGVDIIIEMVGGEIVGKNLQVLGVNGTMWIYGSASGEGYDLPVLGLMQKNHIVRGYWLALETAANRAAYAAELAEKIAGKQLQVFVTEFPLAKAADAHRAIEGRKTTGKIVLTV